MVTLIAEGQLVEGVEISNFIFAGKAIFTVNFTKTSTRFTFNVKLKKATEKFNRPTWFVSLLTGPNNTADYTYIGMLTSVTAEALTLTKASQVNTDSNSVKALNYLLKALTIGQRNAVTNPLDASVEFLHLGYCGKCGKPLTDPVSIKTGLGPICRRS